MIVVSLNFVQGHLGVLFCRTNSLCFQKRFKLSIECISDKKTCFLSSTELVEYSKGIISHVGRWPLIKVLLQGQRAEETSLKSSPDVTGNNSESFQLLS